MCRKLVANVLNTFIFFIFIFFAKVCHKTVARLSGEQIKLSDIRTNVVRRSHECLATVVQIKMKLKLHSWDRRKTHSRMSRDYIATVARYVFKIRQKFANLSHKCPFNETAT